MRRLRPLRRIPGLIPRQLGDRPSYTPAQTERYKSPWERLSKAQEIFANWALMVREEAVSEQVTLYRITSDRSPWGYWTVAVNRDPSDPSLPSPLLPPLPLDPGGGSGGGGGGPINVDAYAGYIDAFGDPYPGRPPGMNYSLTFVAVNGIFGFPYPTGESFPGGVIVTNPGAGQIRTAIDLTGQALAAVEGVEVVWYLHSKFYLLAGDPVQVWLGVYRGPGPDDPLSFDTENLWGYLPNVSDPLSSGSFPATGVGTLTPLTITGGGGGGGSADPNTPSIEPPPLEPSDPPLYFNCDCPDYSQIEEIDPDSPYPSRWQRREWVGSEAGCTVNDQGIGCKHTIAVALFLGIPFP